MANEVSAMLLEAETQLDQMCRLSFEEPAKHRRLTGIVCTIGPASRSVGTLYKMMAAGMNIVRMNFSHESHEYHAQTIDMVRHVSAIYSKDMGYQVHIAIALDTKGPEIRTGMIDNNREVELKIGDTFRLSVNKDLMERGTRESVYVDFLNIINVMQPGDKIYLSDGTIMLVVKEVAVDCVVCQIEIGGMLGSRKSVRIPELCLDLPAVSEKDVYDIKFGVDHHIDFIFASSVREVSTIKHIRNVLGDKGKDIKIISKIDTMKGLVQLRDIAAASDGILFDRGDVSVEISAERVFILQKAVLAHCNRAGKPVICATQLLESMRKKLTPRRAEVSDLGNAVLDGADCLMLSSESAIGMYPVEATMAMATITREAESALWYRSLFEDLILRNPAALDAAHAIAISAVESAKKALAAAIIVLTTSGRSAYLVSKYRPRCPIVAVTRCPRTARQSHLYRAVVPLLYTALPDEDWHKDVDNRLHYSLNIGKKMGIIHPGDPVIVISPWKEGTGFTNNMRIVYAFFEQESMQCMLKAEDRLSKWAVMV